MWIEVLWTGFSCDLDTLPWSQINDDINMLVSMRLSPFFKEFVQKNRKWEDRLNNIRVVSDIWIDVQR